MCQIVDGVLALAASEKPKENLTAGEKLLLEKWKSSKGLEQDAQLVGAPKKVDERRLVALMFTDMVGYTALSQNDEELALEILEEHRSLLRPIFRKHGGREVKTIGDAFLVEFPSAFEAVKCSLDIQPAIADFNIDRPIDRKFQLRIGIHLGDAIHRDNDVYGDAVNIASRIHGLCEAGSVCISEEVYLQVKNKLDNTHFVRIGKRKLKNVKTSVQVYTLKT
jgi:adenylate cyclase